MCISQSGIVKVSKQILPPSVATSYVCDVGVAVPSANILDVNGGTSMQTIGSGNQILINYTGTPGGIVTIDGDSGSMTGNTVTISGGTTGLTTSASSTTMNLTGILNLAHGGTNANLTASNGGIFYSTASAAAILAGTTTAGQIIRSGASTTPSWSTATYPATAGTSGNVLTSDGTNWNSTAPAASGSTTYFSAYLSTPQTISATTSTRIVFNTTVSNVGSAYSTGTGLFTAPATGFYGFSATVFIIAAAGITAIDLGFLGSVYGTTSFQVDSSAFSVSRQYQATFSWNIPMTAGDTLGVEVYLSGTGSSTTSSGTLGATFNSQMLFSGYRIA